MPLAITMGDPAGIGPEIALAAWRDRRDSALPPFYILADPDVLEARATLIGLDIPLQVCLAEEAEDVFDVALPVVALASKADPGVGAAAKTSPDAVVEAIETAVADVRRGVAGAVVTNPITKKSLYAAGFAHPGHTEFLGALAEVHWPGEPATPVMMLAGPDLRTVPITVHIPLAGVPAALTLDRVLDVARVASRDLRDRFGIARPRLALAGLNPHAGEGGTMGTEDADILAPAVARLRDEGVDIVGPLPADTMFHARARAAYDMALCPYHDQALIPVKTLAFDETVNVTLGLPFVRTSPDHGTAFDIAGKGIARADSLIAAIRLAGNLCGETSGKDVA